MDTGEAGFFPFGAMSGIGLLLAMYREVDLTLCIYCSFRFCAAETIVLQICVFLFFFRKADNEELFYRFL